MSMFTTLSMTTSFVRNTNSYIIRQQIVMDVENTKAEGIFVPNVQPKNCAHQMQKMKKTIKRHIWQHYIEMAEDIRHTPKYRELYKKRKETIERVFADAKEKHAMRFTQYRGLTQVTKWVKLKFAAMNLKKIALWKWKRTHRPMLATT